ncbi:hypothetical protein LX36DRAFT_735113 [Colletotrichum falcatum]|nr:hypothetical protein LX36DRAFT_735113 [Colletotrichum falcatum]
MTIIKPTKSYKIGPIQLSDINNNHTYIAANPNGRLRSIQDPNTDLTLWESGAIIEYLTEKYDKTHKLSFVAGTADVCHARQWLFFKTNSHCQRPYCGQAMWFIGYQPIPEAHGKSGSCTGSRFSYADITIPVAQFNHDEYPHVKQWAENKLARPSVEKLLQPQDAE